MDETVSRSRYPRKNVPARRKKRSARETNAFLETFMRQVVLALIFLAVIGIIKNINTPVTNFLCDKTKYFISKDIQLKDIYTKFNAYLDNLFPGEGKKTQEKDGTAIDASISTTAEDAGNSANIGSDNGLSTQESNKTANQSDDEDTKKIIESMKSKYSFVTPVEGSITSGFGERIHPAWKTISFHTGIDIEAKKGLPIKAALEGIVLEAGISETYGKYLKLEHGDGIITLYGHCSQLLVKKGENVDKGKIVAKVGNTGVSVGAHLHFEIWKDGKPLNPQEFIKVSG